MSIVEAVVAIIAILAVADLIKFNIKARTDRYTSSVQQTNLSYPGRSTELDSFERD
jgi:hypothetical protein